MGHLGSLKKNCGIVDDCKVAWPAQSFLKMEQWCSRFKTLIKSSHLLFELHGFPATVMVTEAPTSRFVP